MPTVQDSRPRARGWRRNPLVALIVVLGLLGGVVGLNAVAGADTTITPSEPGAGLDGAGLVRDDSITIKESPGGQNIGMTATQAFLCGLGGSVPSTTFSIVDPNGDPVAITQPTAGAGEKQITLALTDRPVGKYQVTTQVTNRQRFGSGAQACVAVPLAPQVQEFEYRPWQHQFNDVLGNGSIKFNLTPVMESAQELGNLSGAVFAGGITTYAMPGGSFGLPSDPSGCASDPASCLPAAAVQCDPNASDCVPRIVLIQRSGGGEELSGVFDLDTGAFIAVGNIGNSTRRVLLSLGSEGDAVFGRILDQLETAASAQGIDLLTILGTKVRVRTGDTELKVSLLDGLQIDPAAGPGGIQIISDFTAQAGVLLYIGGGASAPIGGLGGECPASASSEDDLDEFDPVEGFGGFRVSRLPIQLPALPDIPLPALPVTGAPSALPIGDIFHLETVEPEDGILATLIGADTLADAPTGLPLWVAPVDGIPVTEPRDFEFIGTGSWNVSYTPFLGLACVNVNVLVGVGVGLANNPLPLGLSNLVRNTNRLVGPLLKPLMAQVNLAVAAITGELTANPSVAALLENLFETLGSVETE